jgi:NADH:ubiquinone oxidoreductase subunit 5 (subunit L)/multisubunit Na+/H+ antiporter MnhA subunit
VVGKEIVYGFGNPYLVNSTATVAGIWPDCVCFLNRNNTVTHVVALGAIITSWLLSWFIVFNAVFGMGAEQLREHPIAASFAWLPTGAGALRMGVAVDHLTVFNVVLCTIGVRLDFFSIVLVTPTSAKKRDLRDEPGLPPHHGREPMYSRFFAYLCLFAAGMLTLTVADNLLLLFVWLGSDGAVFVLVDRLLVCSRL